jgi:hypothetical protein
MFCLHMITRFIIASPCQRAYVQYDRVKHRRISRFAISPPPPVIFASWRPRHIFGKQQFSRTEAMKRHYYNAITVV